MVSSPIPPEPVFTLPVYDYTQEPSARFQQFMGNLIRYLHTLQEATLPLPLDKVLAFATSRQEMLLPRHAGSAWQWLHYVVDLRVNPLQASTVIAASGFEALGYHDSEVTMASLLGFVIPKHRLEITNLAMAAIDMIRNLRLGTEEFSWFTFNVMSADGRLYRMVRYNFYLGFMPDMPPGVYVSVCAFCPEHGRPHRRVNAWFNCNHISRNKINPFLMHYDAELMGALPDGFYEEDIELLQRLAEGLSMKEIAQHAHNGNRTSEYSVRSRIRYLQEELFGVQDAHSLVAVAAQYGLVYVTPKFREKGKNRK